MMHSLLLMVGRGPLVEPVKNSMIPLDGYKKRKKKKKAVRTTTQKTRGEGGVEDEGAKRDRKKGIQFSSASTQCDSIVM